MTSHDDDRTARQIARAKTRKAGDRSAKLANQLMALSAPAIAGLALDDDLRETIERARAVTARVARRRAERTLAGELRRYDLVEIAEQLVAVQQGADAKVQQFHLAERWRARLIDEGIGAAA